MFLYNALSFMQRSRQRERPPKYMQLAACHVGVLKLKQTYKGSSF